MLGDSKAEYFPQEPQIDPSTVYVATWTNGLFVLSSGTKRHELAGRAVEGIEVGEDGALVAIVEGSSLQRREPSGRWSIIANTDHPLSCFALVGEDFYVGTHDARVFRLVGEGDLQQLEGFDAVPGRSEWYAGSAVVDGVVVGPPLGVRSIAATCDGRALVANVHVGGLPRSVDGGSSWHPTIEIDSDVHEVFAHSTRGDLLVAAAATGLCLSTDGGESWVTETEGLDYPHCSAVATTATDILVSSSESPFSEWGSLYRRRIEPDGGIEPVEGGLPRRLEGIVDTACLSVRSHRLALCDAGGNVYVSGDGGLTWSLLVGGLPSPSSVALA